MKLCNVHGHDDVGNENKVNVNVEVMTSEIESNTEITGYKLFDVDRKVSDKLNSEVEKGYYELRNVLKRVNFNWTIA